MPIDFDEISPELLERLAESNSELKEYLDEANRPFVEAYEKAIEAERRDKIKYALLVEHIWDEAYKAAWEDFQKSKTKEEIEARKKRNGKDKLLLWIAVFIILFLFILYSRN